MRGTEISGQKGSGKWFLAKTGAVQCKAKQTKVKKERFLSSLGKKI